MPPLWPPPRPGCWPSPPARATGHDPDRPTGTGADRRPHRSAPLPALPDGNRVRAAAALQDGAHRPAVRLHLPAPLRAGLHPVRARLGARYRDHGPAAGRGADPGAAPLRPAVDAGGGRRAGGGRVDVAARIHRLRTGPVKVCPATTYRNRPWTTTPRLNPSTTSR